MRVMSNSLGSKGNRVYPCIQRRSTRYNPPMAKKKSSFLLWQKIVVGGIAVVSIGVLGFLYTLVLTDAPGGEFVEGQHYFLLEEPRRVRGDNVEVMEFFSYACIHCYNFDAPLEAWAEDREDRINFIRTPAISNATWRLLGGAYYALEEMDLLDEHHWALFQAIHDRGLRLDSVDRLVDFMAERNVDAERFRALFTSPLIQNKLNQADLLARRMRIASVPSIVVDGQYLVRTTATVGPTRMLEVMDHLVEKASAPASAVAESSTESGPSD